MRVITGDETGLIKVGRLGDSRRSVHRLLSFSKYLHGSHAVICESRELVLEVFTTQLDHNVFHSDMKSDTLRTSGLRGLPCDESFDSPHLAFS